MRLLLNKLFAKIMSGPHAERIRALQTMGPNINPEAMFEILDP